MTEATDTLDATTLEAELRRSLGDDTVEVHELEDARESGRAAHATGAHLLVVPLGGYGGLHLLEELRRATRVPIIDLPTTAEAGLEGVDATVWNAFFYPKGTPREIVLKMNRALNAMIERPDVAKRMGELGLTILPRAQRTPEHLAAFLPKDIARWGKVIRDAGLAAMAGK